MGKNRLKIFKDGRFWIIPKWAILIFVYLFLRDFNIKIPYIILFKTSTELRLIVVLIVGVLIYNPSYKLLVIIIICTLVLYSLLIIFFANKEFDAAGSMIYVLLLFVVIKMFRKLYAK